MNFAAIVRDYTTRHREKARREVRYYMLQRSLEDAVREAALSRLPSGKRHPHQRRIPLRILQAAERRLRAIAVQLQAATSFAELHDLIDRQIKPIRGIGDLAVYDIAHRIGAYLRHAPDAVYLHAGTREGARALNLAGKTIDMSELPAGLRKLSAAEIEDCLCIYKDALLGRELRFGTRTLCQRGLSFFSSANSDGS
jgi:hypothetical protein